jgi:DNA polymerase alpha subunit B
MSEINEDLSSYFLSSSDHGLPPDILGELESILRLHSISPQELFYKWESYSMKMGSEETKLDLDTVRMFKKDVQDGLERESRGKHAVRVDRRSAVAATPRGAVTGDVFGMYGTMD